MNVLILAHFGLRNKSADSYASVHRGRLALLTRRESEDPVRSPQMGHTRGIDKYRFLLPVLSQG